jgi:hypothetical protein
MSIASIISRFPNWWIAYKRWIRNTTRSFSRLFQTMDAGKRLKDISGLPLDLAVLAG